MIKIIISYAFEYEQEDAQFSCQIDKQKHSILYDVSLPLMDNTGLLIESPSANPYSVPLPYGIKSFDYTIKPAHAKSILISAPWLLGVEKSKVNNEFSSGSETVNAGLHKWGTINEYPTENTISQVILESDTLMYYSGHVILPVINGKSPDYLFKVDGSGNSIFMACENTTTPTVGDLLFTLKIYNIEFGGVPSPDY